LSAAELAWTYPIQACPIPHLPTQDFKEPKTKSVMKKITIQYFALLREERGLSKETYATQAKTPRELYAELKKKHPFSLGTDLLRVAVNDVFSDWDTPLQEGDSIVFIPPVAGG
jgi:molybdopterin converting factor subunit 1